MLTSVGPQPTMLSWFHRSTQVRSACAAGRAREWVERVSPRRPPAAEPGVVDASEAAASAEPPISATTVYLLTRSTFVHSDHQSRRPVQMNRPSSAPVFGNVPRASRQNDGVADSWFSASLRFRIVIDDGDLDFGDSVVVFRATDWDRAFGRAFGDRARDGGELRERRGRAGRTSAPRSSDARSAR
jgi:hypothetical protein